MTSIPVILIFDIGKTNKKILLFNEQYEVVLEKSVQFPEIKDEDGYPCDDVEALTNWVKLSVEEISQEPAYSVRAIHCTAYGASFVYIDEAGKVVAPLYNYLKPLQASTKELFVERYGPLSRICLQTASPDLDNLNSGLQLFRLKVEHPETFSRIKWALHLPQYIHYVITGEIASDITSIGCHTFLWDFSKNNYHYWVMEEHIEKILPPIRSHVGLHDSSSALIPYFKTFAEPFVLISTGTWCISLNPFNQTPLTVEELNNDTLCYMSYTGQPIKASRLFAGKKHEVELQKLKEADLDANQFEDAYRLLMDEIVAEQVKSTNLVLTGSDVKKIFVDGGFSKNEHYMRGLVKAYPGIQIFAAEVAQATALGAALSMHSEWNNSPIPEHFLEMVAYS
jgi:sugar (pentulose or hexulose) kinase